MRGYPDWSLAGATSVRPARRVPSKDGGVLMGRVGRSALAAALLAALMLTPAAARTAFPSFGSVVIVLAPYLAWSDIGPDTTPGLYQLAADAALGNATVRSASIVPDPGPAAGAAVLAAGRPLPPGDPAARTADALLGEAVHAAGGRTAAVGTSALTTADALSPDSSSATILARDRNGAIDSAETSARVLRTATSAPAGVTTDLDVMEMAYRRALLQGADETGAPLLVVLDPGDLARARATAVPGAWRSVRAAAVATTDAVVRLALRSLPADGALLVVATAQSGDAGPAGYGPVLLYGAGPGILSSASTRVEGVVTLPDVTETVLSLLSLQRDSSMTGSGLELVREGDEAGVRLAFVTSADASARALESTRVPLWAGTIIGALALLGVALAAALLPGLGLSARARALAGHGLAALCAVPAATLLAQAAGAPSTPRDAWTRIGIALACVVAVSLWFSRGRGPQGACAVVAGGTAALVLADQMIGGPAAFGSAFSYSPLFGARFYGLGNEGAAVLVGAILAFAGGRVDRFGAHRAKDHLGLGALAVAVSVLPVLGANFGVVAWGTAAFVAAFLYGSSRRLDRRTVFVSVGAAVALLAVAAGIDALLPGSSHLGRSIGAAGGLVPMVLRKVGLSLGILTATPVVILLPVAVGAIVYLLARPTGPLGETVTENRGVASALVGGVTAAMLALVTEDSGVAISALVLLMPAAAFAQASLARGAVHGQ